MLDSLLLEKKCRQIEELLREIESFPIQKKLENFSKDIVFKRFIERNIELAIEQIISISKHFISGLDLSEPETYASSLDILQQALILKPDHLELYKSMVRCRNILVHAYEKIDDSIVYGIYRKRLNDFREFIQEVRDYIRNIKKPS